MKKARNNTTLVLIAILSFLMGIFLIGAFSLHLRHREEAREQAALEQQQAEQKRLEELARAQAEEEERKKQEEELKRLEEAARQAKDKAKQELKGDLTVLSKKKVSARELIDNASRDMLHDILDEVINLDYEFIVDKILEHQN